MQIIETIKEAEGYRRFAYRDHLGHLTIGYGTMIEDGGQGISPEVAEMLICEKIEQLYSAFLDFDWFYQLNSARKRAIVEMGYQIGFGGVCKFERMIDALEREDWQGAHDEALDSLWYEQTPSRAERVANILLTGREQ